MILPLILHSFLFSITHSYIHLSTHHQFRLKYIICLDQSLLLTFHPSTLQLNNDNVYACDSVYIYISISIITSVTTWLSLLSLYYVLSYHLFTMHSSHDSKHNFISDVINCYAILCYCKYEVHNIHVVFLI